MSIKHVNKYYNQICEQYREMIQDIKDLEEEATQGLVEPERIDRLKTQIEPIKINYERWAYMMFLLKQPNRPSKVKRYQAQNKKLLANLDKANSVESVINENNIALQEVGK